MEQFTLPTPKTWNPETPLPRESYLDGAMKAEEKNGPAEERKSDYEGFLNYIDEFDHDFQEACLHYAEYLRGEREGSEAFLGHEIGVTFIRMHQAHGIVPETVIKARDILQKVIGDALDPVNLKNTLDGFIGEFTAVETMAQLSTQLENFEMLQGSDIYYPMSSEDCRQGVDWFLRLANGTVMAIQVKTYEMEPGGNSFAFSFSSESRLGEVLDCLSYSRHAGPEKRVKKKNEIESSCLKTLQYCTGTEYKAGYEVIPVLIALPNQDSIKLSDSFSEYIDDVTGKPSGDMTRFLGSDLERIAKRAPRDLDALHINARKPLQPPRVPRIASGGALKL